MSGRRIPRELVGKPVTTADALEVVTPGRLYGHAYQSLLHGTHMAADEPRTHSRLMIAFRRTYGPEPVFGGPTAAWAHGCHLAGPTMPIFVLGDLARTANSMIRLRARLAIVRAGSPEPTTQCPVILDGRVVAKLDLGWEEYRAGAEYDGAVHLERRQHSRDLDRHNGIRVAGWSVLQVDNRLLGRTERLAERLARLVPRR